MEEQMRVAFEDLGHDLFEFGRDFFTDRDKYEISFSICLVVISCLIGSVPPILVSRLDRPEGEKTIFMIFWTTLLVGTIGWGCTLLYSHFLQWRIRRQQLDLYSRTPLRALQMGQRERLSFRGSRPEIVVENMSSSTSGENSAAGAHQTSVLTTYISATQIDNTEIQPSTSSGYGATWELPQSELPTYGSKPQSVGGEVPSSTSRDCSPTEDFLQPQPSTGDIGVASESYPECFNCGGMSRLHPDRVASDPSVPGYLMRDIRSPTTKSRRRFTM